MGLIRRVFLGLPILFVAACGASAGDESTSAVQSLPAVVAASGDVPGAVPSTTMPVRLDGRGCIGEAVEVVERILIERRNGGASPLCVTGARSDTASSTMPCWAACADGRVFVDIDLDTTRPAEQRTNPTTGDIEMVVPFAARYSSGNGTTTAAESVVVIPSAVPGAWEFVELIVVDLELEQGAAASLAEEYLGAIRRGDFRTAAELMVGTSTDTSLQRDDLGRLADEGMLSGASLGEVADGLAQWCASGAECTIEPSLEIEVTATHDVRVIATYDRTGETFETTFQIRNGSIEGLPLKAP